VAQAAAIEAHALRLVGPRLPVAVPEWRLHARGVIAYPRLPGTPAITFAADGAPVWNIVDPAAPAPAFLDSFAAVLAALQAIGVETAKSAGLPVRRLDDVRQELAQVMDGTRDVLRPSEALWTRWRRWVDDDATWPPHLALVHGDLHPGHLLLDERGRLTGILDWTEACVGDPATDVAMFFGAFGTEALRELLPRFEQAGGRTWPALARHAVERWTAFPASVAAWGLRTGNEAVLAHARLLLQASEARAAATA
jgi:aminoglycoside phosphotransferase (APT) family kinase protein